MKLFKYKPSMNKGFSLVEIMVALLLGSFVIAMAVQFAFSNKTTYLLNNAVANLQQNGRFSLDFFARELRLAGYAGCVNTNSTYPNVVASDPMPVDFTQDGAVRGYKGVGATFDPVLPAGVTLTNAKEDSDAILIQRTQATSLPLRESMVGSDGQIRAQGTSDPSLAFDVGDFLVISNCSRLDIFQATSANNPPNPTQIDIDHGSTRNVSDQFSNVYSTDANVTKLSSYILFIEETPNGRFFLSRKNVLDPSAPVEQLVPDVELMRISYGVSDDGDEVPNQYLQANAVTDWENVYSVRVDLVIRSTKPILQEPQPYDFLGVTQTPTDTYFRKTFSNVVFLRNRGGI